MRGLIRVAAGLLGGGILYSSWLAVFLVVGRDTEPVEAVLWLTAPVITAIGFAAGVALAQRFLGTTTWFWRVLPWPLIGCAIGAAAIFWYGPMLIVFTMFMGGVLALALREAHARQKGDDP
jgi:hypothetical protein